MASIKSVHNIIVHILDVNDNVPYFQQTQYYGRISESAKVGTYIYKTDSTRYKLYIIYINLSQMYFCLNFISQSYIFNGIRFRHGKE